MNLAWGEESIMLWHVAQSCCLEDLVGQLGGAMAKSTPKGGSPFCGVLHTNLEAKPVQVKAKTEIQAASSL